MAEEMTNQSSETSNDFAIEELNDTSESSEETADTSSTESSETTDTTPEDFLNIRYNGADKALTKEEAVTLAQKGMNYDKVYGKLQDLENSPIIKTFKEQADRAGLSLEDYANRLADFQKESSIQSIANDFMAKYPDSTDEIAKQYAEKAYESQVAKKEAEERHKAEQDEKAQNDKLVQEVQEFTERFPDVDVNSLPNSVIEDINNGMPLMQAYLLYENHELKTRASNKETEAKNNSSSVGSLKDNNGNAKHDGFLTGLLGK